MPEEKAKCGYESRPGPQTIADVTISSDGRVVHDCGSANGVVVLADNGCGESSVSSDGSLVAYPGTPLKNTEDVRVANELQGNGVWFQAGDSTPPDKSALEDRVATTVSGALGGEAREFAADAASAASGDVSSAGDAVTATAGASVEAGEVPEAAVARPAAQESPVALESATATVIASEASVQDTADALATLAASPANAAAEAAGNVTSSVTGDGAASAERHAVTKRFVSEQPAPDSGQDSDLLSHPAPVGHVKTFVVGRSPSGLTVSIVIAIGPEEGRDENGLGASLLARRVSMTPDDAAAFSRDLPDLLSSSVSFAAPGEAGEVTDGARQADVHHSALPRVNSEEPAPLSRVGGLCGHNPLQYVWSSGMAGILLGMISDRGYCKEQPPLMSHGDAPWTAVLPSFGEHHWLVEDAFLTLI